MIICPECGKPLGPSLIFEKKFSCFNKDCRYYQCGFDIKGIEHLKR